MTKRIGRDGKNLTKKADFTNLKLWKVEYNGTLMRQMRINDASTQSQVAVLDCLRHLKKVVGFKLDFWM